MSLDYVKDMTANSDLVEKIYNRVEKRLLSKIEADEVPEKLEYIVEEITIERFNRVGSEGMSRESVEGHSVTFFDRDVFEPYERAIEDYLSEDDDGPLEKGVLHFL